jgi:urea transporter
MKNIKIILRGIGQVMLQNNAWTGFFFLLGISYNSWIMGLGALLGTFIGTISARFLKYSKDDIENGLYGFNGTLVGIAVYYFFHFNFYALMAVIIGSIISTVIMHEMKKRIPAYTAPFILSTWIMIFIIGLFKLAPPVIYSNLSFNSFNYIASTFTGVGQVMFQGSVITGFLFLIGILINSRKSALYAIYGSILGALFALLISLPLSSINIGLFGYNAVLCGIALEGKGYKNFIFATLGILLSVLLNLWMGNIGIITLTAPFVISTWIILIVKKYYIK